MKYIQSIAVLALLFDTCSAGNDIQKKLDELKAQIQEDVRITNKLNKSLKHLKSRHDDQTLVVINKSLDLHKKTATIQENKDQFDHLTTLEKIKLDNYNDAAENKAAINKLMQDLDTIHKNEFTITKNFRAIEADNTEKELEQALPSSQSANQTAAAQSRVQVASIPYTERIVSNDQDEKETLPFIDAGDTQTERDGTYTRQHKRESNAQKDVLPFIDAGDTQQERDGTYTRQHKKDSNAQRDTLPYIDAGDTQQERDGTYTRQHKREANAQKDVLPFIDAGDTQQERDGTYTRQHKKDSNAQTKVLPFIDAGDTQQERDGTYTRQHKREANA